jgi:Flp pilus assembly protein TadG
VERARAATTARLRRDQAAGVFSTAFGFGVFLVFLLFAVQLMFGLYARTTVTSVAADLARRAASEGAQLTPDRFDAYADAARERLGRYGDDTSFSFALIDVDADGLADTVAVTVDASLPTLLPVRWSGYSPTEFTRTMRARLEVFQEDERATR